MTTIKDRPQSRYTDDEIAALKEERLRKSTEYLEYLENLAFENATVPEWFTAVKEANRLMRNAGVKHRRILRDFREQDLDQGPGRICSPALS